MRAETLIINFMGFSFILIGLITILYNYSTSSIYYAIGFIITGLILIFAIYNMNKNRGNRNNEIGEIFLKNIINLELDDPQLAKIKISNIINQLNDETILVNIKDYIKFNKISANSVIMNDESLWNNPKFIIQNLSEEGNSNLDNLQNKLNNKIESNTIRKEELILIILFKFSEYIEFIKQPENQYDINPSINSNNNTIMNYCPGCGQELLKNTNFCHKCGYEIINLHIGQNPEKSSQNTLNQKEEQSKFILFKLLFGSVKPNEVTRKNISFGMIFCIGAAILIGFETYVAGLQPYNSSNVNIYIIELILTFFFIGLSLRFIYYYLSYDS